MSFDITHRSNKKLSSVSDIEQTAKNRGEKIAWWEEGSARWEACMKAVEGRSYDPETIELMRTVLDEAWGLLEPKQRASTNKTEIAVRILNFGSKADMATLIGDVRYTPKSGHFRAFGCPLSTKGGH